MKETDQLKNLMESLDRIAEEFEKIPKYSYYNDFKRTHPSLPMSWSIYDDSGRFTTAPGIDDNVLDFTTDAPDGVYMVYFIYIDKVGVAKGVVVKDGAFDIVPTINAITQARDDVGYWGSFIERMDFDSKRNAFKVTIGS